MVSPAQELHLGLPRCVGAQALGPSAFPGALAGSGRSFPHCATVPLPRVSVLNRRNGRVGDTRKEHGAEIAQVLSPRLLRSFLLLHSCI